MSSPEENLVSFIIYSVFVYPVTNYIVSPSRKYPRWKAALYAILFLVLVGVLQLNYESMEAGPNHYQLLNIQRGSPDSHIKKAYRVLSLEFHPDKNKAATATDDFNRINHAYDILIDKEKRREYERLGEAGVTMAGKSVIDLQYLVVQLVVHYGTSLIFAFMMTFSEPTGDAFLFSVFVLLVMLWLEMLLVIKEVSLPVWLFPQTTSHEVINICHRLFPAFMNGCRCICGAFYIDHKKHREEALEAVILATKAASMKLVAVVRSVEELMKVSTEEDTSEGFMATQLSAIKTRLLSSKENEGLGAVVEKRVALINNPVALKKATKPEDRTTFDMFRNLLVYLLARFAFIRATNGAFMTK